MIKNHKDLQTIARDFMTTSNIHEQAPFTEEELHWIFTNFFIAIEFGVSSLLRLPQYDGLRISMISDAIQSTEFQYSYLLADGYDSETIGAISREEFHLDIGRSRQRIRLPVDEQIQFITFLDFALKLIKHRFAEIKNTDLAFILNRKRINQMVDYYGRQRS